MTDEMAEAALELAHLVHEGQAPKIPGEGAEPFEEHREDLVKESLGKLANAMARPTPLAPRRAKRTRKP